MCGYEVFAVDADIWDEAVAAHILKLAEKILGPIVCLRKGRKGWAALYRSAEPTGSPTSVGGIPPQDEGRSERERTPGKVEMFGEKYLACNGPHPDTGEKYKWRKVGDVARNPCNTKVSDLTEVTPLQRARFAKAVREYLLSLEWQLGAAKEQPANGRPSSSEANDISPISAQEWLARLGFCDPSLPREDRDTGATWLKVLAGSAHPDTKIIGECTPPSGALVGVADEELSHAERKGVLDVWSNWVEGETNIFRGTPKREVNYKSLDDVEAAYNSVMKRGAATLASFKWISNEGGYRTRNFEADDDSGEKAKARIQIKVRKPSGRATAPAKNIRR